MAKMAKAALKTVLATVDSDSRVGVQYEIRLGGDDRVYCTCPAWRFSKSRDCKHLRAFRHTVRAVA